MKINANNLLLFIKKYIQVDHEADIMISAWPLTSKTTKVPYFGIINT